eukprot:gnl/Hemi2/5310_TR1835_c0_g1_i1.p2 gnl/Hemi2/5310_TR1835_c0_g1~~gnl/Hemi2/5310_TR1835_c0_g1_i1.p2  ORF type:complete len:260 (+),score=103.95 gnl/Hemi2/5310_TR1835_c0_g1_i1:59-838(+)
MAADSRARPATSSLTRENTIFLFDVDGTLSKSRQLATPKMKQLLKNLRTKVTIGTVGGSDLAKQKEQLGEDVQNDFDYVFSENGLLAFKGEEKLGEQSIIGFFGEEVLQDIINFCLIFIGNVRCPKKRGNHIELRKGMINACPIGRSCSQAEREEFFEFDNKNGIRRQFAAALEEKFPGLKCSLGGQISIDIFPHGWDKTYCLRYLDQFENVFFFGDQTQPGGNDHEIYTAERTFGNQVHNPENTMELLAGFFPDIRVD